MLYWPQTHSENTLRSSPPFNDFEVTTLALILVLCINTVFSVSLHPSSSSSSWVSLLASISFQVKHTNTCIACIRSKRIPFHQDKKFLEIWRSQEGCSYSATKTESLTVSPYNNFFAAACMSLSVKYCDAYMQFLVRMAYNIMSSCSIKF